MPKCIKNGIGLARIKRRQISTSFDSGEVCSDGELMLLRAALFILATTQELLPAFAANDNAGKKFQVANNRT